MPTTVNSTRIAPCLIPEHHPIPRTSLSEYIYQECRVSEVYCQNVSDSTPLKRDIPGTTCQAHTLASTPPKRASTLHGHDVRHMLQIRRAHASGSSLKNLYLVFPALTHKAT